MDAPKPKAAKAFWDALEKNAAQAASQKAGGDRPARFAPAAWPVSASFSDGRKFDVKIIELAQGGARFIAPEEVAVGTSMRVRIEDPAFHEVLEVDARVCRVTPPPPVATTWIVATEFVKLTHDEELRVAKWAFHYTSDEITKRRTRTG